MTFNFENLEKILKNHCFSQKTSHIELQTFKIIFIPYRVIFFNLEYFKSFFKNEWYRQFAGVSSPCSGGRGVDRPK